MARKKKEEIEEIKEVKVEIEPKKEIPNTYILRVGETLADVAKKFGISEEELNKINNYPTVIGGNQIKLK